ncbi:MAG TPA: malonyl CoA-acyl carrier protein transacylase, partial [Trueperaceae bacterium]
AALAGVSFQTPELDIVCNVTADVLTDVAEAPGLLVEQVTAPVRWTESVQKLAALGVDRFLEFGSGKVLTGLVGRILPGVKAHAVTDMASLEAVL